MKEEILRLKAYNSEDRVNWKVFYRGVMLTGITELEITYIPETSNLKELRKNE